MDVATRRRTVLRVQGLSVTFGSRRGTLAAASDVDLEIGSGELLALLGESGSGKSATARAIMGLQTPNATVEADEMSLAGTDLLRLSENERRRIRGNRMSMVFQDALSALNPVLSIGDQIGELFRAHRGVSRREAKERATELLAMVGIPAPKRRIGQYPHEFSGGMRQRILIAMAIALEPELLIADEPTTALDVTIQAQILELLDTLRQRLNMAVLFITHDLGVVSEIADRAAVMYGGRIVEAGTADDLFDRPSHPYTEALLASVPRAGGRREEFALIPGSPPNPLRLPSGCAFHPRCAWAVEKCESTRPPLVEFAGRMTACHRAEEVHRGSE
ncbi:MAG: ATP-binding cassette domain-containing protein [Streptosporangiales bacterium]|nr:ATP-binding cassette domain-containing protein [Streptosporangiales bacterium]